MTALLTRNRNIATSTQKMEAYPSSRSLRRKSLKEELLPKGKPIRDYVPISVALGMIGLSLTFGLLTAKQQLLYAPDVHVNKSRRETLPEVMEPEDVARESEEFVKKSFFRKVARIQEEKDPVISNPIRGDPLTR